MYLLLNIMLVCRRVSLRIGATPWEAFTLCWYQWMRLSSKRKRTFVFSPLFVRCIFVDKYRGIFPGLDVGDSGESWRFQCFWGGVEGWGGDFGFWMILWVYFAFGGKKNGGKIWWPQVFCCFFHFVFNLCSRFGRANIFQCFFLGGFFSTLGVPTERRCLRPWWNCSITPNAGVNVPPMWVWSRRTAWEVNMRGPCCIGDMEGNGRHWNEMMKGIPNMFWRTLVGWNLDVHILFFLGSKQIFFLESDSFLQLWVSHRHRLLQEFGDMAQHTKAVLKSVSIAPVDPTGEKGVLFCCESFFAASKSEHMWKDNSASYIFSEWLYCKIAIIFGVQNTIDTSFVQQDFLPSLFRVNFFAYPASWCKRLPTRWWFLVAFSTHENTHVLGFHPVLPKKDGWTFETQKPLRWNLAVLSMWELK